MIQAVIDYQPVRNKIKYLVYISFTGSKTTMSFELLIFPTLPECEGAGWGEVGG